MPDDTPLPTDGGSGSSSADSGTGGAAPTVVGVLAGILVFLLIVAGILLLTSERDPEADDLVGTPVAPETPVPTPGTEGTPEPTPTPVAEPTPTPDPDEGERDPTDADAAAFSSRYEPPGASQVESVTVDLNGDGWAEIVVVSQVNATVRLDVAAWTGEAYDVVFTDQGGPADEVAEFTVRDLNGSGTREIIVLQRHGADGESLSVWGWDGEAIERQAARGGCWDGSHTYGVVGVQVQDRQIHATCDDSPEPQSDWGTHIYTWDAELGAWVFTDDADEANEADEESL